MRGDVFNAGDVVDVDAANYDGTRWRARCVVQGHTRGDNQELFVLRAEQHAPGDVPDRENACDSVHAQTCTLVKRAAPEVSFLAYVLPFVWRCAQPRPERGTLRGNWRDVKASLAAAERLRRIKAGGSG